MRVYKEINVLEKSRERIRYIFDNFDSIIVSVSGGKDSTVLASLAIEEAKKRGRVIGMFFLDEEVVYQNTIEQVDYLMNISPENTKRWWLQVPFHLTNATSLKDSQLISWDPKRKKDWMRKRKIYNVLNPPWGNNPTISNKKKGFGFYDAISNFEDCFENTAFLVGLRTDESLNRFRTMIKNPGYKDILWSTKKKKNFTFYPIYDWHMNDIFKYIYDNDLKYHKYYDFKFKKGINANELRVSSLIHEKSFKSISELPEFEPDTYNKLVKRIGGIAFAQETAKDKKAFKVNKLPKNYKTWKEYRDFLLKTYQDQDKKSIFVKRFSKHLENEYVYRQQCRQLFLNDYENNLPVDNKLDPVQETLKKWRDIL